MLPYVLFWGNVEGDQSPRHYKTVGRPLGVSVGESFIPLRHIYVEIYVGSIKPEQASMKIWSICSTGTGGPGELCVHQMDILLQYVQG